MSFFGGERGFLRAVRPVMGTPMAMTIGTAMPIRSAAAPMRSAKRRIFRSMVRSTGRFWARLRASMAMRAPPSPARLPMGRAVTRKKRNSQRSIFVIWFDSAPTDLRSTMRRRRRLIWLKKIWNTAQTVVTKRMPITRESRLPVPSALEG